MPKKGATKPQTKDKSTAKKVTEATPKNASSIARGKSEFEIDALITDVALKPDGLTFEKIAQKYNINQRRLYDLRVEHSEAIKQKQQDFFTEHKANVIRALLSSCEGFKAETPKGDYQHPPNPKSMELFFGLEGANSGTQDIDPYRLFDEYYPLQKQAQFIYSGDPLGRFSLNFLISGIAYGKTAALVEKALILARRNRKRLGMVIAPTYKMLQHPILEYMFTRLNQLGIKYKFRKADGELVLWDDTTILLRSADNADNLRGPTIAWAVGDEIRNWDKMAYDIVLGRIRDPNSRDRQFAGTTTPDGFNWIYDEVEGEKAKKLGDAGQLFVYYARTEENPHLPADFIELVRNTYDAEFAEQELDGKFLPVGRGLIYHCFNRTVNIKPCKFDPSLPVWICQDFNVNPMATVLAQPHRRTDGLTEVHVFDELAIRDANIQHTIAALKAMSFDPKTYKGEMRIYPDSTGWNRSANAEKSSLDQLRNEGYEIVSPRVNPLIRDRYAAVNGKLKNANGLATLFVDPKCKHLITDLERELYKDGSPIREASKDGASKRGHHSDALGYAIHNEFRIESGFLPARLS